MEYEKILIICVDRDADIERKVGETCPIYGKEALLGAAMRLGVADPTESDTNALFETIRLGNVLGEEGKQVEVVAICGTENLGVESDIKISKQLDEVLEKRKVDGVILVTDGAEDEYILPIVESKTNVITLHRVIVKQSERLESTYYVLQSFLKDVVNDPKLSRLLIGLPGVAALLYMLLGEHGWRLIVGVVGTFLMIKGFNLESTVQEFYEELKSSLVSGNISSFTYAVAALIAAVGIMAGYDELSAVRYQDLLDALPLFLSGSIDFLMFAAIIALVGKSIDGLLERRGIWKYVVLAVFVIAFRIVVDAVSLFLLDEISRVDLTLSIILGTLLSVVAIISSRAVRPAIP